MNVLKMSIQTASISELRACIETRYKVKGIQKYGKEQLIQFIEMYDLNYYRFVADKYIIKANEEDERIAIRQREKEMKELDTKELATLIPHHVAVKCLDESSQCSICFDKLTEVNVRMIKCGHAVCDTCKKILNDSTKLCPECRIPFA